MRIYLTYFNDIADPHTGNAKQYLLSEIIFIGFFTGFSRS